MTQISVKEKTAIDMSERKSIQAITRRSWIPVGMLGLVVVALVVGATIAGIFVGRNMTSDIYGEAWATFHNKDTDTTMKQRFIVDGQEVAIVKPGELTAILDYEKNHVVMQVDGMRLHPTNDCLCFVYNFDTTTLMDLEEVAETLHSGNVEAEGSFPVKKSQLHVSGNLINLSSLSKRSVELCDGCTILQASTEESKGAKGLERRKRRNVVCPSGISMFALTGVIEIKQQDDGRVDAFGASKNDGTGIAIETSWPTNFEFEFETFSFTVEDTLSSDGVILWDNPFLQDHNECNTHDFIGIEITL